MKELLSRYPELCVCESSILKAVEELYKAFISCGKLLVCGNGGSCADCEHIVGELMKGFLLQRKVSDGVFDLNNAEEKYIAEHLQGALPAISLPHQSAIISAYSNDVEPDLIYAQLVYGYGKSGDVLLCLSTSGNSKNVVYAARTAKSLGIKTIAMTGKNESRLSEICDITIKVPETETYKIQELHLPIYHYICAELEKRFFV